MYDQGRMPTSNNTTHQAIDSLVHRALLLGMIADGFPPVFGSLASEFGVAEQVIADALRRLEANHGLVLHPGSLEPWVVHPFSLTPTLFWVENARLGWWAPCIWCALGVAWLVDGPVRICTVLGGERERCEMTFDRGRIDPPGLWAHFPIPAARAWDNVHRHCACTLVFRDHSEVARWCTLHGVGRGEILAVEKVAELAHAWYGHHLAPDWRKRTAAEAAETFHRLGLTSAHWSLPPTPQRF